MAGRQRTTFQKRQREAKRLEKQRMKAEKRTSRRLEKAKNRTLAEPGMPPPAPEPALQLIPAVATTARSIARGTNLQRRCSGTNIRKKILAREITTPAKGHA